MPKLRDTYELKEEGVLGPEPTDAKQVRRLNRMIRFAPFTTKLPLLFQLKHGDPPFPGFGEAEAGATGMREGDRC